MQVRVIQRALKPGRSIRFSIAAALLAALMLSEAGAITLEEQRAKDSNDKLYRDGSKAIRAGRYEDAIAAFNRILDTDGRDVQARLWAALAYLKNQDYRRCYEAAKEALKINPDSARAHALVAAALLRSGYVPHAVEELVKAFKLDQKEPLAFWTAAEVDYYEGRAADARARAYQAYLLDPREPDYVLTYAHSCSRLEMFREAAEAFELFLQLAPKNDTDRRESIKGLIQFYRKLAGLKIHQISGPGVAEVPFQLRADRRPYMRLKVNGRDATFVIDTGSGFTVISQEAAKRLGVSEVSRGGKSQAFGGDGKFPIVYGLVKSIQLGEAQVRSVPCFIRQFHAPKDSAGEQADGYIGLSVLSHFLTELDYRGRLMRLDRSPGAALAASPEATVVPFRRTSNGMISIETAFDGNQLINAILDSGASSSVVSAAAVERLNMRGQIIEGETTQVFGAAGVADNVARVFIRQCRVANLERSNIRALVLDFGAINETSGFEQSGILGGDFLMNFRVTIDFNRALVAFNPPAESVTRRDYQ
jgi:predicted aspartyl protease/Flp pilus assembly protein TadD